jgi:hypothetical protein
MIRLEGRDVDPHRSWHCTSPSEGQPRLIRRGCPSTKLEQIAGSESVPSEGQRDPLTGFFEVTQW